MAPRNRCGRDRCSEGNDAFVTMFLGLMCLMFRFLLAFSKGGFVVISSVALEVC